MENTPIVQKVYCGKCSVHIYNTIRKVKPGPKMDANDFVGAEHLPYFRFNDPENGKQMVCPNCDVEFSYNNTFIGDDKIILGYQF